jgi:hypothetical protein
MPRSQSDAGELARDIRQVFALAGLPESVEDNAAGGYHISAYGDRVKVSWWTESGFYNQAGTIGLSHAQHAERPDATGGQAAELWGQEGLSISDD